MISLDDVYANALIDYVLYRAYSKDAEFASQEPLASKYYSQLLNHLGLKEQAEGAAEPARAFGKETARR